MRAAFSEALSLILSLDGELLQIMEVTLRMSLSSALLSLLLGVPLGALLAMASFPGRRALIVANRTLMGLPPVVCGLLCYLLFSGVGPLGPLRLLYTVRGMVAAQVMLITPVIAGNVETFLAGLTGGLLETARGLGLGRGKTFLLTLNECKYQLVSTFLLGFSRAIAEVGAVSMVGGAIAHKTNVMTTAIMNYTNMGDFTLGLALGIILLGMSLAVNLVTFLLQGRFPP